MPRPRQRGQYELLSETPMLFLEKEIVAEQNCVAKPTCSFSHLTVKQDYLSTECESCEQEYEWLV
jgi:hypothetical protein